MRKNAWFISLLVTLAVASCTTRKDGFAYRVFHNTTARFNGYFYARLAMQEADLTLNAVHKDDYDEVLPLFVYGEEKDAEQIFPLMERAIEKSSRVIERHKMEPMGSSKKARKRPEMNKWIDDNYLLIGVAYFYKRNYPKAEEMFLYVSRKYKEPDMQALSNAWLTRVYMQRDQIGKAKVAIQKAESIKELDDDVRAEVHLVYADLLIREANWKDATTQIEYALRYIKRKRDKARPTFVLAQLLQQQNKSQEAIAMYNAVLKLKPEYEMEFYSKIMQAMAFDRRGGNSERIKEILFKLLKDEKNLEYNDVIFYALAEIALEEQQRDLTYDYLEQSVSSSVSNEKQKMKSFLRLADLNFEDKDYMAAQMYYDSTASLIAEDHPRYDEVKNKAESLTELVYHLNLIADRDSVLAICDMPEEERIAKLEEVREQMERELEEARRAAELAAASGQTVDAGTGTFWPYNTQLKQSGRQNFINYWGDRKLEDNWRRKNKVNMNFGDSEEEEETTEEEEIVEESSGDAIPSVDELLASLPCSDEGKAGALDAVANAYFQSGVVYKEKLDDVENAIEQWEVLVTKYDSSAFHPTSYYLLFRTYLFKESQGYQNPFCGTCNSQYWGDLILDRYPGTEWALLVENPDYQDVAEVKKKEESAAYEIELNRYYQRDYLNVLLNTKAVIDSFPDNHLICKYKLLNALSIGAMDAMTGQRNNHIEALERVVKECPESDEASFATERLKYLRGDEKPAEPQVDPNEVVEQTSTESPFSYDEAARHYFMVVLPLKGSDVNNLKANLSDFSAKNFQTLALKVSSNLIDRENQVVLVKTFNRLDDAKQYFNLFSSSADLEALRALGYPASLISKENYVTLFKNKNLEGYQKFFEANYKP